MTTSAATRHAELRNTLPPFALRPVVAITGLVSVVLVARADRYDYFGDELYFLSAGARLAFGYVDQGPLLPLLARCVDWIAPGSLVALRIPSIVAAVLAIVTAAASAREFGGGRIAQVLAALAYACCPFAITQSATLSTFALDATLVAVLIWLIVRWIRIRDDRLLIAATVVVALDLQVKLLAPVLGAGIAIGVMIFGPRDLLRRPALWFGAAFSLATVLPGLGWQARHGWPQLAMGATIRAEQQAATGGIAGLPMQLAMLTGIGGFLAVVGIWALVRHSALRPYRFIVVAVVVQSGFVLVTGTRAYYVAGLLPVLFAAGAVWAQAREFSRWEKATGITMAALAATIAVAVVFLLPVSSGALDRPTNTQSELSTRMRVFGSSGWSELTASVDAAYRTIDLGARAHTVIVTQTYWAASVLDRLGSPDLPPIYSPNRGFAYFGKPSETDTTVLYVAADAAEPLLRQTFWDVRPLKRLDDRLGFPGINRNIVIWRCDRSIRPWAETWPHLITNVLDPGI
ncbi:glycosyltransferase family 39 protein [Nocardia sp. NPDC049737]|uniref:glycosyltransferase family 39 protein n=1 Tax=Nocardia sp. NPDC049737 TaxID=3154358 RepID=UPI00341822F7